MLMVGEQFEGKDNDDICGAVVQNRGKGDRVAVWTENAANGESVMRIGAKFKEAVMWEKTVPYVAHAGKGPSSAISAKYQV